MRSCLDEMICRLSFHTRPSIVTWAMPKERRRRHPPRRHPPQGEGCVGGKSVTFAELGGHTEELGQKGVSLVSMGSFFLWPLKGKGGVVASHAASMRRPSSLPPSMACWCAKRHGGRKQPATKEPSSVDRQAIEEDSKDQDAAEVRASSSPVQQSADHLAGDGAAGEIRGSLTLRTASVPVPGLPQHSSRVVPARHVYFPSVVSWRADGGEAAGGGGGHGKEEGLVVGGRDRGVEWQAGGWWSVWRLREGDFCKAPTTVEGWKSRMRQVRGWDAIRNRHQERVFEVVGALPGFDPCRWVALPLARRFELYQVCKFRCMRLSQFAYAHTGTCIHTCTKIGTHAHTHTHTHTHTFMSSQLLAFWQARYEWAKSRRFSALPSWYHPASLTWHFNF